MNQTLELEIVCDACEKRGSVNPSPAIEVCGQCGRRLCADCARGICPWCGSSEREPIMLSTLAVYPSDVDAAHEQYLSECGAEEAMR